MIRAPFSAALAAVSKLAHEIARRRTFAIISRPDAGKTTLTEKLLWFGGAIQAAGEVRARKALLDRSEANLAKDGAGDYVYLAPNRVNLQMAQERHPDIAFPETREIR